MKIYSQQRQNRPKTSSHGFTLVELLVVVAILGILASIAVPAFMTALARADRSRMLADGRVLFTAMVRYNIDVGAFPSTVTPPTAFDRRTLEPLVGTGHLRSAEGITSRLLDGEVTAYDSPDIGGGDNREFWAVLTSAHDPASKLLVASTENYPGYSGGLEGLYWIEGSTVVPAS
jgi:prepilin-type N-terminal cleavage/methylation domain-containing protein